MQAVLSITLPFFALIGCGYIAGRRKFFGDDGIRGLNGFVFYFALPALIFRSLATRPIADIVSPEFMAAYAAAGLAVFAVAALGGRLLFGGPIGHNALQGQAASVGNVGFLALPMIVGVLGPAAALPVVLGWLVDLVVLVPLSIALIEGGRHDAGAGADFLVKVARGVILNPFVLSIAAGVAYAASGFPLPGPLDTFAGLMGTAAAPTALFALGATLAGRPMAEAMNEAVFMSALKLGLHPALMFAAMALFFDGDPMWATAAVLTAAAPVAGNVFIVAQGFGIYVLRASSAIVVSTAAAVLTFSAAVALLVR